MNRIALKMLMGDRLKYLSLVAGLAFAAFLVTQQASIFAGYALRTGAWIRDTKSGDLWVMDKDAEFTEANKTITDNTLMRTRGIEGVEWAMPIYKGYFNCQLPDGTHVRIRLIGLDDTTLIGGPPEMVAGQLADLRRDKAVIVNLADVQDALQMKNGLAGGGARTLQVGDTIGINDHDVVVVGMYKSTTEFFWEPVIYTTYSRAMTIAPPERKLLTFVLVKVRAGESIPAVAERIRQQTGYKALTNDQFEAETMDYVLKKTGIRLNFGMTVLLGFIIGVLVAGQTMFAFILDHTRYFAVLRAMGTSNGTLIRMVILQVMVVGISAYGIGLGASSIAGIVLIKEGFAYQTVWQIPVLGAGAILICCVGAALIGITRVLRIEPGIVFK